MQLPQMLYPPQAGPLPVLNGVTTPISGLKQMGNWSYISTYRDDFNPFIIGGGVQSKQVTLLLGIAEEDGSRRRYSFSGDLSLSSSRVELSW